MPSLSSILVAAAVFSFSVAVPYEWPLSCPADRPFYKCDNGYIGCCSKNPCQPNNGCPDTPSFPKAVIPSPPANPQQPACTPGKRFLPQLFTVKPDDPCYARPNKTSPYYVRQDEDGKTNEHQVVLAFSDIPAGAKNCNLQWTQPAAGRNFGYYLNGLLDLIDIKLNGKKFAEVFDVKDVSYKNIQPFIGEKSGQVDMTNWPQVATNETHGGASPKNGCASELAFLTKLVDVSFEDKEAALIMQDSETSGWYVQWTC